MTAATLAPVLTPRVVIEVIEDAMQHIAKHDIRATLERLEQMLMTASRRPYIPVEDFISFTDAADALYFAIRGRAVRSISDAVSILQRAVNLIRQAVSA